MGRPVLHSEIAFADGTEVGALCPAEMISMARKGRKQTVSPGNSIDIYKKALSHAF